MNISSNNEFGKLKAVVIGRPDGANWPKDDPHFQTYWKFGAKGPAKFPYDIPAEIIAEVNENIYNICDRLKEHDVEVVRPRSANWKTAFATHDWACTGMNNLTMRETLITIGNKVIECPHIYRSKHYESISYETIKKYVQANGGVYISAPRNSLEKLTMWQPGVGDKLEARNDSPIFSGADILKFGKMILYFISCKSNLAGAEWLQSVLGDEYKVRTTKRFYNYESLCNNIMPLDETTLLVNADRVGGAEAIPKEFKDYKKIWVNELKDKKSFKHQLGSKYYNFQVLNIDARHKLVNSSQPELCELLNAHGFEIVQSTLVHTQTFAYGYHSLMCDLIRE